ncbi:unnamed protein product [Pylaiella littoralis]
MFDLVSDVVLRYEAPSTCCANAAAAAAAVATAGAAATVVPFWQQGGDHILDEAEECGGRSTELEAARGVRRTTAAAPATPTTCPSTVIAPALLTSPAAESDEASFNLADLRVALEEAVDSGHVEESAVRRILLQVATHSSTEGNGGGSPLHVAAALGQERIVMVLLLKGANPDALDSKGRTPLHLAVEYDHLSAVKVILAANPDMSIRYKVASRGYSVLDLAAREGNVDVLRALLQHGVDVNRRTDGYTSLHIAALNNRVGAIDVLVEAGADMEVDDDYECTPFLDACSNHCHEAALTLFKYGAKVEARDIRGETPLQTAARQAGREGVPAIVNLLLRCGGDETAVNPEGRTASEIVGHHMEYAACPLEKAGVDRVRKLLANAPADRAWRRRGFLVLCRAFRTKGRFLTTTTTRNESQNRKVLHDINVSGGNSYAWTGEKERRQQQRGVIGSGMGSALENVPNKQVEKAVSADSLRSVVVRVLELVEEGLFRNIVGFL